MSPSDIRVHAFVECDSRASTIRKISKNVQVNAERPQFTSHCAQGALDARRWGLLGLVADRHKAGYVISTSRYGYFCPILEILAPNLNVKTKWLA